MKPRIKLMLVVLVVPLLVTAFDFVPGVLAQEETTPPLIVTTEVPIPQTSVEANVEGFFVGKVKGLAEYIDILYIWLTSIVGLVAAVAMVLGGFQYLTAGGDKNRADAGKKRVQNALMGLVLALTAYVLLDQVNPNLVNFKSLDTGRVKTITFGLPFCEHLTRQDPNNPNKPVIEVTSVTGTTDKCGDVGKFALGNETENYCVFKGSGCPPENYKAAFDDDVTFRQVCMPRMDMTMTEAREIIKETLAQGKQLNRGEFAVCSSCLDYAFDALTAKTERGSGRIKRPARQRVPDGTCEYWAEVANEGPFSDKTWERLDPPKIVSACVYARENGSCYAVDINCGDSPASQSCEKYEGMTPIRGAEILEGGNEVGVSIPVYKPAMSASRRQNTINAHPEVLAEVCSANPCGFNKTYGAGGCKADAGYKDVALFLTHGIFGATECANK